MDELEKVERLREKTGCTYHEAKAALEESDGDMLEALCWLEQNGKRDLPQAGTAENKTKEEKQSKEPRNPGVFLEGLQSLWDGLVKLLRSCVETELVMTSKKGKREFGVPLLLALLLLYLVFWPMIVLLLLAMFFGNRFSLEGTLGRQNVNDALGKATDFAEAVKDTIFQEDGEQ